MEKELAILRNDPWLEPYKPAIDGRHNDVIKKFDELTANSDGSLSKFANAYKYYGLHRQANGTWLFRDYLPNAEKVVLIGDFSNWQSDERYALTRLLDGSWEGKFAADMIHNGDLYKMRVYWHGGEGDRIPAYATRVVQDPDTKIFSAEVYAPETPYKFKTTRFRPDTRPLLIYEAHIGMAEEKEGVGTYEEFRVNILPRIAKDGYNAIQLMAIQEHPYYGSFGYHVSSFYAASSRFGTPDDLKRLIDEAHSLGIAVIMDIVHSHAVKNENEGLGRIDGSHNLYFYGDGRREHPAWDSLCFDYGKNYVLYFLLSNCKYWMEEYRFDGFRFDGVTSMLYHDHGLGTDFNTNDKYFSMNTHTEAITYLQLANELIRQVNPKAITIAEDMSGMPGMALPIADGGIGFDYRLGMGLPDMWVHTVKERKDEFWDIFKMWCDMCMRRPGENTVAYVESHDQALVGDKTMIFRLADAAMYTDMEKSTHNPVIDRAIALHKMIRLYTLAGGGEAYLNFMGNEFGHPEWIDFPREGNGWSFHYCRRQWSLRDNGLLKYEWLGQFDEDMIKLTKEADLFSMRMGDLRMKDSDKQVIVFYRKGLLFAFNFSPSRSYTDIRVPLPTIADYTVALCTDDSVYGGFDQVQHITYPAQVDGQGNSAITLYLPARTAVVLREIPREKEKEAAPAAKAEKEAEAVDAPKAEAVTEAAETPKKPRKPRAPKDPAKPRRKKSAKAE